MTPGLAQLADLRKSNLNYRVVMTVFGAATLIAAIEVATRYAGPALSQIEPQRTMATGARKSRDGTSSSRSNIDVTHQRSYQALGKLRLQFEANEGRTDRRVRFISRGPNYGLFLTSSEAVLNLTGATMAEGAAKGNATISSDRLPTPSTLRMQVVRENKRVQLRGLDKSATSTNYFVGNDPERWRTNVHPFERVEYSDIYPGIDLIFYGNQQQLEYDFRVAAGANPRQIGLRFKGASRAHVESSGDLVLETTVGDVRLGKPNVYQEEHGERQPVTASFVIKPGKSGANARIEIGFEIGKYDPGKPLVIDPTLTYTNVFGGNSNDNANGVAVDSAGNSYIVGTTSSANFPVMAAAQSTLAGGSDVFVTKVSPSGTLLYSTFIGGTLDEEGRAIAVDSAGAVYLTGSTRSTNFPTVSPLQAANAGGFSDVFVTKLNPAGSAVVYSSYVGGTDQEAGTGIAVDSSASAYVTGYTKSSTFPTKPGSFQTTFGGGTCTGIPNRPCSDAFVFKLNPAGNASIYSTFLGGSADENIDSLGNIYGAIAVDSGGNAYVTGTTSSLNYPTAGALQSACNTCDSFHPDAFLTKLNSAGSALVYSTYFGGMFEDFSGAIAVDASGSAYITGTTGSTDLPVTNGSYQNIVHGGLDAFITKFSPSASALVYSTYFGGDGNELAHGIAVDSTGNAYVVGTTNSADLPIVSAIQPKGGGGLFKTTNGATTWGVSNSGLPINNNAVVIDPTNSNVLYCANGFGIAKSGDAGATWIGTAYYNSSSVFSLALDPGTPSVIYGGILSGVVKSTNGGTTWTTSTTGLENIGFVAGLVINPTNTSVLYAATSAGGVRKSTNGGATWTAMNTGLTGGNFIDALAIDKNTPNTLYAGKGTGVFKTTDGAATWTDSSVGLPTSRIVTGLAFDPATTSTIYATTVLAGNVQGGVFKSTNGGGSWTTLVRTSFSMGAIVIDPASPGTIYAASNPNGNLGTSAPSSGVGVLKSTDGGATWTSFGLRQDFIQGLTIDPNHSSRLYAPTNGGNDIFVLELNSTGTALFYSTYLGGTGAEQGNHIAVTPGGKVYVAGATASTDFPTQVGSSPAANPEDAIDGYAKPSFDTSIAAQQVDDAAVAVINACTYANLIINKTVESYDANSKHIKFKITITNAGLGKVQGPVYMEDHSEAGNILSIKPSDPSWNCASTESFGNCFSSDTPAFENATFEVECDASELLSSNPSMTLRNTASLVSSFFQHCDLDHANDTATATFKVSEAPAITTFSPISGSAFSTVTITGRGFTGATGVSINGIPAFTYVINSDTQITFVVASESTNGFITVVTPTGTVISSEIFTVMPTINGLSVDQLFLGKAYLDLWSKPIEPVNLDSFINDLNNGKPRSQVIASILASVTYNEKVVKDLYQYSLRREATNDEVTSGAAFLNGGGTYEQLSAKLIGSSEWLQKLLPSPTNSDFVIQTYIDLLGRIPTASELQNALSALGNGSQSREQLVQLIETSDEYFAKLTDVYFRDFLDRPPTAAESTSKVALFKLGRTDQELIADLLASSEYFNSIGSGVFDLQNNSSPVIFGAGVLPTGVTLSNYSATISWNDLTPNTNATLVPSGPRGFYILGSHPFSPEGNRTITVDLKDQAQHSGQMNIPVRVLDAPLKIQRLTTGAVKGDAFNGKVADFSDSGPDSPSDYQARISWGDGTANDGTITLIPGPVAQGFAAAAATRFTINGSHTYTANGDFAVKVELTSKGGSTATANSRVRVQPDAIQLTAAAYTVAENAGSADISLSRTGDISAAASVMIITSDNASGQNCNVTNSNASSRCDYISARQLIDFAPGETAKSVGVLIVDDSYVEGNETFTIALSNPSDAILAAQSTATLTINDNDATTGPNPIDVAGSFVTEHYYDFLNRQPDPSGLAFWTNEITSCGNNQSCIDAKRVNVSAAYFLSIEFQQTGYLVERLYKVSFGDASGASTFPNPHQLPVPIVRFNEFLADIQRLGHGVVVGQPGWETVLENNKQAFVSELVQRSRFITALPTTLTPPQFVDTLNTNAGNVLSTNERTTAINLFGAAVNTTNTSARTQVLRQVAEDPDLVNAEFNRAFVLMQFFGYLRRDPNSTPDTDYTGYDFWLTKLNQFNGNFVDAEMVKAFLNSSEYRIRFGP